MATDIDTDDELAVRIHDAVVGVPGVASIGSGRMDQIVTLLPGRTVAGVSVDDARVTIEVIGSYPPAGSYQDLAGEVRARASTIAASHAIDVVVADIDIDNDTDQED